MGLSTAWGLSRSGWSVTVVDQDEVPNPRGASVDDHRLIRHAYGAQAGYMRMVDAAYDAWGLLWGELGEAFYVSTGVLALGAGGGGWLGESRSALRRDDRHRACAKSHSRRPVCGEPEKSTKIRVF